MIHIMQREGMARNYLADLVMLEIERIGKIVLLSIIFKYVYNISERFGTSLFLKIMALLCMYVGLFIDW